MKKLTALFLAIVILLMTAACGAPAAVEDKPTTQTAVEETPEPEYTYKADFVELGGVENYLTVRCHANGGFYATAGVMISNNIPAGVTPEYESQYYQYEQRLYFISMDGTVRRLRGYSTLVLDEDRSDVLGYTQSNNIASMLISDDGELTVLEAVDEGWYKKIVSAKGVESEGDYVARQRWFVRTLDDSGAEIKRCEIELETGEWLDGYKAVTDGSGNIVAIDRAGIRGVDGDGKTVWHVDSGEAVGNVLKLGDGTVCVLSWGDCWSVAAVDTATGTLSAAARLPKDVYSVSAGQGRQLLYIRGNELFTFDIDTGESSRVLSFLSCDINVETVSNLTALESGAIAGVVTVYASAGESYLTELFKLERTVADETVDENALSFGTIALDSEIRGRILEHNRRGAGSRIDIIDYSSCDDPTGQLTEDIRSGSAPDIIDLTGLDVYALAAEGLLDDLYPYIDADSELSREDYFENLLSACEYNGTLVSTCPGFYISTVIAAQNAVGTATAWTFDDYTAAAAGMAPDCSIMEVYSTREEVLAELLALCHDELVGTAAGVCDFQSELFIQILRFSMLFPAEYDWSGFSDDADDSTYFRLKTGRQMLSQVNIFKPEDIFACDADFEGDAAFIGYPVAEGCGSGLVREWGYAISASSDAKAEVWEFLRPYFTEEYQSGFRGIPALKRLFDSELEKAMTAEYYPDAYGDPLIDENGQPIAVVRASFGDEDRDGDTVESFSAVTTEQAQRLRQLIDDAVRTPDYDDELFGLVRDKTTAFFAGILSAEEAAAVVQGAVSEYLANR